MKSLLWTWLALGLCAGCAKSAPLAPAPLRVNQRGMEARASVLSSQAEPPPQATAAPEVPTTSTHEERQPSADTNGEPSTMVRKAPTPEESGARVHIKPAPGSEQAASETPVPAPSFQAIDMRDQRRERFARREQERVQSESSGR